MTYALHGVCPLFIQLYRVICFIMNIILIIIRETLITPEIYCCRKNDKGPDTIFQWLITVPSYNITYHNCVLWFLCIIVRSYEFSSSKYVLPDVARSISLLVIFQRLKVLSLTFSLRTQTTLRRYQVWT